MLASFIFSLLAGLLVVHVEPYLKRLVEKYDRYEMRLDAMELRILTFGLLLLVAAILTWAVDADSSAYLTIAGGLLGYFGADLYAFLRDPDGAMGEDEDDWDGQMRPAEPETEGEDDDDTDETLRAVKNAVQPEEETDR